MIEKEIVMDDREQREIEDRPKFLISAGRFRGGSTAAFSYPEGRLITWLVINLS